MDTRITEPARLLPGVVPAIEKLLGVARSGGVPESTLELVHLRASQINACSFCVLYGTRNARKAGETDERLATVGAWREAPFFTAAERAALELTEYATRMADRSDAVPDAVWAATAEHFDEQGLAAIVLTIATTNFVNRLNVTTRQPAVP